MIRFPFQQKKLDHPLMRLDKASGTAALHLNIKGRAGLAIRKRWRAMRVLPKSWWRSFSGGVLKLLDPVFELNPLNDFWQSICAAELSPFLLRWHHQLEGHRHRCFAVQAAPGLAGPVPHGGEDTLDGVGGSDVLPMFGWEVIERQQHVAILGVNAGAKLRQCAGAIVRHLAGSGRTKTAPLCGK